MPRLSRYLVVASMVAVTACAGKAAAPGLAFGPTAGPLVYDVATYGSVDIDTPMGNQRAVDSLQGTVRIEIGAPVGDQWEVSAVFEELRASSGGDMGRQIVEGGELIGKEFTGALSRNGVIEVTAAPAAPTDLADMVDPSFVLAEILGPLPADPASTEPWPVHSVVTSRTALAVTATYEGTARIAGDTTWEGRPARIIVSEGSYVLEGSGTPPGAPGEIKMYMTGTSQRRYIWDAARGVMLQSEVTVEADGPITLQVMNLSMEAAATNRQIVRLRR